MKRFWAFVVLAAAVTGCGGGGSGSLPQTRMDAGLPAQPPVLPAAVRTVPASRDFARPVLPSALSALKMGALSAADKSALDAKRIALGSARKTQGRSTGFFANEVYVGQGSGYAVYWLPSFGYYTYAGTTQGSIPYPGFLYKYNFAWLYDLGPSNAQASDAYFYDFGAPDGDIGVFYTSANYGSDANTLYLYDFTFGATLGYLESSTSPRWFYNYATNAWLNGNAPLTETAGGGAAYVRPDTHHTLYYLDVESASSQSCTAGCLNAWPALVPIPASSPTAGMSIIIRADGASKQWTYQGHPLYTFVGDSGPDGASGDGAPDFGGHWHVARPAGTIVTTPPPTPTDPPCYGYC